MRTFAAFPPSRSLTGFSTVLTQLRSAPVSRALPATWPAGLVFIRGQAPSPRAAEPVPGNLSSSSFGDWLRSLWRRCLSRATYPRFLLGTGTFATGCGASPWQPILVFIWGLAPEPFAEVPVPGSLSSISLGDRHLRQGLRSQSLGAGVAAADPWQYPRPSACHSQHSESPVP